ncbi:MAG: DUF5995 family protein [Gammaproteobacteria bacterium]|nr:DUF5995 family protein [Gammaproteobacteria bacterium]
MPKSKPPGGLHAQTIDAVIASLDRIVDWSIENNQRTGYFAALYRKVTINVKHGIDNGTFDDAARMERLDVIFANRYLDAFEAYYAGLPVTQSWQLAFEATERWFPLVLQHLMIGMNAHINLDLGIAAAETVPAEQLAKLETDFNKINTLLIGMIDEVEKNLAKIWPLFSLMDKLAGRLDEKLAAQSMEFARNQAWKYALTYAAATDKETCIHDMDSRLCLLAKGLLGVGLLELSWFLFIRVLERGNVAKKITALV